MSIAPHRTDPQAEFSHISKNDHALKLLHSLSDLHGRIWLSSDEDFISNEISNYCTFLADTFAGIDSDLVRQCCWVLASSLHEFETTTQAFLGHGSKLRNFILSHIGENEELPPEKTFQHLGRLYQKMSDNYGTSPTKLEVARMLTDTTAHNSRLRLSPYPPDLNILLLGFIAVRGTEFNRHKHMTDIGNYLLRNRSKLNAYETVRLFAAFDSETSQELGWRPLHTSLRKFYDNETINTAKEVVELLCHHDSYKDGIKTLNYFESALDQFKRYNGIQRKCSIKLIRSIAFYLYHHPNAETLPEQSRFKIGQALHRCGIPEHLLASSYGDFFFPIKLMAKISGAQNKQIPIEPLPIAEDHDPIEIAEPLSQNSLPTPVIENSAVVKGQPSERSQEQSRDLVKEFNSHIKRINAASEDEYDNAVVMYEKWILDNEHLMSPSFAIRSLKVRLQYPNIPLDGIVRETLIRTMKNLQITPEVSQFNINIAQEAIFISSLIDDRDLFRDICNSCSESFLESCLQDDNFYLTTVRAYISFGMEISSKMYSDFERIFKKINPGAPSYTPHERQIFNSIKALIHQQGKSDTLFAHEGASLGGAMVDFVIAEQGDPQDINRAKKLYLIEFLGPQHFIFDEPELGLRLTDRLRFRVFNNLRKYRNQDIELITIDFEEWNREVSLERISNKTAREDFLLKKIPILAATHQEDPNDTHPLLS